MTKPATKRFRAADGRLVVFPRRLMVVDGATRGRPSYPSAGDNVTLLGRDALRDPKGEFLPADKPITVDMRDPEVAIFCRKREVAGDLVDVEAELAAGAPPAPPPKPDPTAPMTTSLKSAPRTAAPAKE